MSHKKHSVSLVLGSGGARGLTHIGVIEILDELGFDIQAISGSSMGALIGGIYAAGKLDAYTHWVKALNRLDVIRLLDFSFSQKGLIKGQRIINVLKGLIGDVNIEDLSIAFTAVASDIENGKEVWFNQGPLFDAIRASISIPTLITPYQYNGRHLFDGGLVNPIPIAPTLGNHTDFTVAVNLSAKAEAEFEHCTHPQETTEEDLRYHQRILKYIESLQKRRPDTELKSLGLFDVVSKSMDTMQGAISRFQLAAYSPDIIVDIPKNACSFHEFYRARELIEIGRIKAKAALSALIE